MKRPVVIAASVLVALAASAWFYVSPSWTLSRMQAAADRRDADALAQYVDFPTLRGQIKADVKAMAVVHAARPDANPLEAAGAAIAMSMLDPLVDAMVSPEGLRASFAQKPDAGERNGLGVNASGGEIKRYGLNEFRVVPRDPKANGGSLIFRRSGVAWRLSGIEMPKPEVQKATSSDHS